MPILRLAYTTLFLIALLAVFELWSQVGGQTHLDLMPWYIKLVLGTGAAFATVKAAAAAVSGEKAWNRRTLRWTAILIVLLVFCGLASYYVHLYGEQDNDDDQDQPQQSVSQIYQLRPVSASLLSTAVQNAHRRAPMGMVLRHSGHCLVVAAGGAPGFLNRASIMFIGFTTRK
jgi:preprotein translocase subunit SecG